MAHEYRGYGIKLVTSILIFKHLHVLCATLSLAGFALRAYWAFKQNDLLAHRVTRILPHVIDTLLLVSALVMVWQYRLDIAEQAWLISKIAGLSFYIVAGIWTLKKAKNTRQRLTAFILAAASFGFIVSVAISKSPWGFLF